MALFGRKNGKAGTTIPLACMYCAFGARAADPQMILCEKVGVVSPEHHCWRYQYDPLARVPKRQPRLPHFTAEDFSLD